MILRYFLVVSVLLLSTISSHGQAGVGASRADSLIRLATATYSNNFPRSLELSSTALSLSLANGYKQGIVSATCIRSIIWSNTNRCREAIDALRSVAAIYPAADSVSILSAMGRCWFSHGNYDSALLYTTRAIEARQAAGQLDVRYARECLAMARTCMKLGVGDRAITYYEKARRITEHAGDQSAHAWATDVLAEIYYAKRLYDKAIPLLRQSHLAFQALHEYSGEASALLYLGNVAYMQVKDDSARRYYGLALDRFTALGDSSGMAICYSNLSRIALEAHNTGLAISDAQQALASIRPGNYISVEAGTYQQLGDIYGELKQLAVAAGYIKKALATARAGNNKVVVRDCYKSLSEIYQDMHKSDTAMMFLLYAYRLKDSIEPITFGRQLAEMEAKYKAEIREAEIKDLRQRGVISTLKVQQQRDRLQIQGYLLALLVVIIVASVAVTYFRRSKRLLLEQIKRENLVRETEERERMRISKDIHDELGSGLSRILYLSEDRQATVAPDRQPPQLGHITETARGLIGNMKDLVWAMNPENTTLSSLAARIREYSSEYLEDMPIALETDIPHDIPDRPISKEATRNLFMIVKEALQNMVKYAGAGHVLIRIRVDERFQLMIRDNGRGFDPHQHRQGNGLRNIRLRAQALGAHVHIESSPGNGTTILVEMSVGSMNNETNAAENN